MKQHYILIFFAFISFGANAPELISLGDLKAGPHTIKVTIPMGKPECSSSSAWNVSGVLLGVE
nr:peptide-N-glycosidase F-related protein [uncultured Pedobacter sp.]